MFSNTKTLKQNAAAIRKVLRSAGYMIPVRIEFLHQRTGLPVADVVDALDAVETGSFRLYRQRGQGSAVAWA